MAVLAGTMLAIPGFVALMQVLSSSSYIPAWLIRGLLGAAFSGILLLIWGVFEVRHRAAQILELERVNVRG